MIPGGQDSSRRQTVFFLPIDPRDKNHQDLAKIDFNKPRRAQYMHSAWKKHQDAVFWVDIDLAIREGLTFFQTRPNAMILQGTLPAYCILKVVRLKTGEVLKEKTDRSPRPPPKISSRHDHDWTRGNDEVGFTVEQQPVGKLVQQSCGEVQHAKFSKPTQPKPKPICDRSGKPEDTEDVLVVKGETSRSHEIDEKGLHEELGSSDRSVKPEKLSENIRVMHAHDGSGQLDERKSSSAHTVKEQLASEENRDIASFNADNEFNRAINEENIDFNIPGLPHSAVKQLHGANVHNLIQKIENHPQRQALQSDLQQHRAFNHFSKESQDAIKAAGNTELCEIVDVEPKAQCRACLTYWEVGIVFCTCGHFSKDDTTANKKYIKSVLDLFSIPNFYIRKGRPHGHRYGKKEGDQEYHTANQLQKKCKKRQFLSIHDRFIRDTWFRKTMLELDRTEEVIREMDKLANEDHTHNLIQKIENHPQRHALQSDLQQHRQFNPFSKESRDVIKAAGNTELCELLDVETKAQCKACLAYWDVGIVYCTCGHFLRDDTKENKKYRKFTLDLFSIPNYYIKKGRPHGHSYGKKEGDHEYFLANSLKKKCKKREFLSIHDRFIRDARFRKTMIEMGRTEEVIREMDKLANEDHTHHAIEEEINVYRSNWWIRSNFVGSDTMPVRHRADFKEALSTLRRLKNQDDQAYYQNWWQSSSSSWWNWQDSWWHPSSEYHRDDGPSTDRSGKPAKQ